MNLNIYVPVYNRPEFIFLQKNSIDTYLVTLNPALNIRYVPIINTKNSDMRKALIHACASESIECYVTNIEEDQYYNAGLTAYNYIRDNFFHRHDGLSLILDSDMFFYAPLDILKIIENYDACGIYHQREKRLFKFFNKNYEYLWVGFLLLNHRNFSWKNCKFAPISHITDVGGMTYYYMRKHLKHGLKVKWIKHTPDITHEYRELLPKDIVDSYSPEMGVQIIENSILHYYRGTNWDNSDRALINRKNLFLEEFFSYTEKNKLTLEISKYYDSVSYSRKHYNGIVNNTKDIVRPSFGSYEHY